MTYIKIIFKYFMYFIITMYMILMLSLIFGDYIRSFNKFIKEKINDNKNISHENNITKNNTRNYIVDINKSKKFFNKKIPETNDNNCLKGFQNNYTTLNCYSSGISELSDGWLRIKETNGYFSLGSNYMKNLNNLNNLEIANGNLILSFNNFKNVDQLINLKKVYDTFSLAHNNLENIKGLNNLVYVGNDLSFSSNNLIDLNGLENLKYIGGYLFINGNNLIHLNNLKNLKTVVKSIHMNDNKNLIDIQGICNIDTKEIIVSENMKIEKKCFIASKACGSGEPLNHKFIYSASRNKANFKDFCNLY